MRFTVVFTCGNGHEQKTTFGEGFTREYVDSWVALLIGGHLPALSKDVQGSNENCGICSARVTAQVLEHQEQGEG